MNLSEPYDEWWCCLNSRERVAIKLLTAAWFVNPEYISEANYTVIAFISGLASLTLVNEYFILHYGLTEGFIFPEDLPPEPVLFFDTTLWPLLYAFSFSPNYLCETECIAFDFWL
jgi:hypothetical protein